MNVENLQARIDASKTVIFKAVFPDTTNHYDALFGGTAMQLMDEVAFIAATRFTRKELLLYLQTKYKFQTTNSSRTSLRTGGHCK